MSLDYPWSKYNSLAMFRRAYGCGIEPARVDHATPGFIPGDPSFTAARFRAHCVAAGGFRKTIGKQSSVAVRRAQVRGGSILIPVRGVWRLCRNQNSISLLGRPALRAATAHRFTVVLFAQFFLAATAVHAATEPNLESLATCRDSWLDWKDDQARGAKFTEDLRANYTYQQDRGGFLVPKTPRSVLGLPVARVYPESAGMAVGFSVLVNGGFEATRKAVEKALGKRLKCDDKDDEMFGCNLELGLKKTAFVMTDDKSSKSTLIGCFYFYEK